MRPGRVTLLMLLVLISGALLLGIGGFGLWTELGSVEARARLDARRATIATADAVRRALRDPDVLALIPAARLFTVADGQCEAPPEVLAQVAVPERPEQDLPAPLRSILTEARSTSDARLGGELLAQIHVSPLLDARSRSWVAMLRGFHAERAGDVETRDAMLAALLDATEAYRSVVAGTLTLAASAGSVPPTWAVERAIELDYEIAIGIDARLRQLGAVALADDIFAERRRVAIVTRVTRTASKHLGLLLASTAPVALPAGGGELLLYFPDGEDGGRGAIADPQALLEAIRASGRLDPVPWSGELVIGPRLEAAEPVVAAVCGLRAPVIARGPWYGPLGLAALVGAVALCFAGALFATFRLMRADAMAVRARAEFLQSVTHELKTPLASIRLLAERLESGRVETARQRDYFAMLADESTRLTVLIENVLDLGRIERGERSYDRRQHALRDVVADAVDVFRPLAQRDGIELVQDGDANDARGDVDRGAVVQALLNVLENARKYAKVGGRIAVRVAVADDTFVIDVRDFGPGIPQAERAQVFDRFVRGDDARESVVAGVGLGLYLARSIMRAHGGDLDCVEPDGPGAMFRFRLPLAEAS